MFTIGGGYAMIPLIEREVVNRGWLDKQDFMDLFAMTQSLPGIFAVNISIFVGYKLKKVTGSIVCAGGTILPSFCIILAIALFFNHFQDVTAFFPLLLIAMEECINRNRRGVFALAGCRCPDPGSLHLSSPVASFKMGRIDFTSYRSRIDMEMRSISGIYCFGRYYRRIDLYLLDQRKNETEERRVESEKEDGEIKEK